jgi:2,3-bisphosphoglycerate-dependent phosphoglycerate mutase
MNVTRLIIARHGNTFGSNDTPTRVGGRTDLPLVEKGHAQALALGKALKEHKLIPDIGYSSTLKRTKETLQGALNEMQLNISCLENSLFNEIDYGPDENKAEADVIARVGENALSLWDAEALPPQGWAVDVEAIKQGWIEFAATFAEENKGQTVLIVTSNGIARFAPVLTGDLDEFCSSNNIKLSTGAFSVLEYQTEGVWDVKMWNKRP